MDICKNKKTGKIFIVLEEIGNEGAVMITPDGRVKHLELKFFEDFNSDQDIKELLNNGVITSQQIRSFNRYITS